MKIVLLLLCCIGIGTNVNAEEYKQHTFKQKNELVPEYRALEDTTNNQQILNMCVWTADIAQSIQLGRRVHKEYVRDESKQIVSNILHNDKTNPILVKQIMKIFEIVWDEYTSEVKSTKVFVDQYNKCVRKAKNIIINQENFM